MAARMAVHSTDSDSATPNAPDPSRIKTRNTNFNKVIPPICLRNPTSASSETWTHFYPCTLTPAG